jgi:DNA repair protein RAD50
MTEMNSLGTDHELEDRLGNFGTHIQRQKNKRRQEESKRQDVDDEVVAIRRKHVSLISDLGELRNQEKVC